MPGTPTTATGRNAMVRRSGRKPIRVNKPTGTLHLAIMDVVDRMFAGRGLRKRIAENRDRLFAVALAWSGDRMIADDLVQETLILALQRTGQLRDHARLNAWMYTILSNCWRQYLRRSRDHLEFEDALVAGSDNPEANTSDLEIVNQVRRAITRLPLGQRQTITLVDLGGFSYAEVAEILEIPIGTVMSRLHKSRKALQRTLGRYRSARPAGTAYLRRVK